MNIDKLVIMIVSLLVFGACAHEYKLKCELVGVVDNYPKYALSKKYAHTIRLQYQLKNEYKDTLAIPFWSREGRGVKSAFYAFNNFTGRRVGVKMNGGRKTDGLQLLAPGDSATVVLCLNETDLETLEYDSFVSVHDPRCISTYDFIKRLLVFYSLDESDRSRMKYPIPTLDVVRGKVVVFEYGDK